MSKDIERDGTPLASTTFCARCGTRLTEGFGFCANCGQARGTDSTSTSSRPPTGASDELGSSILDAFAVESSALQDSEDVAERPRTGRHVTRGRIAVAVVAGLVLLLIAGSLANWAWQRQQDNPVRDSFQQADAAFTRAFRAMLESNSMQDIQSSAEDLKSADQRLAAASALARARDSDIGNQAELVLDAETAVVHAGSTLTSLTVSDLTVWSTTRDALTQALGDLEDVAAARTSLLGEGQALATNELLTNLQRTIGTEAASSATASLMTLFADMKSAGSTADLRQIATRAVQTAAGLRASVAGFSPGSSESADLESLAGVYESLAGLTEVDGDHLDRWAAIRTDLAASVGYFHQDEALSGTAQGAANAVDQLVAKAKATLRTWHDSYRAAVSRRRQDIQAVASYRSAGVRLLDRYSGLRADLSSWIDRVEDPATYVSYDEAYRVLSDAQAQRQQVRDDISRLHPPSDLAPTHNQLLAVLDDAIDAVGSAYEGASDSDYCMTSCYYADTPGWRRFSAESSRITESFDTAVTGWTRAVDLAMATAQGERTPVEPNV